MSIGTIASSLYGSTVPLTRAVDRLTTQQDTLQSQLDTGVAADSYAGLGAQRGQALALQPQITMAAAWSGNVTTAQNTLTVTQTAMSSIATIATNLQSSLVSLKSSPSTATVATTAETARLALDQLGTLLNTQSGGRYVFGGTASDQPPVTASPLTESTFFSGIGDAVSGLAGSDATTVGNATLAIAADNGPDTSVFSSALSVPADQAEALQADVAVGEQDRVATGIVASAGTTASATSTGSPIRDLMRALAVVGNLDKTDAAGSNFSGLVDSLSSDMGAVGDGINNMIATTGATQQSLTSRGSGLDALSTALNTQLGSVKDSDYATISTQLNATKTALQESYSMIADMKGMSLAAYL